MPKRPGVVVPWTDAFDVGIDTGTPVDEDYQVPFRLTGKISKFPRFNLRKALKDILRRNIRLRRNSVEHGLRNRRQIARVA